MFSPELKIKHFLDSLAYLLMIGFTNGIETKYKEVMHAKREIPASNCTSDIDNLLYATGEYVDAAREEELSVFASMLDELDERAALYEVRKDRKPPQKKVKSRFSKRIKQGISGGEWCRVDTEGKFWFGNDQYIIDDQEVQYQPVSTEYGDYYAMDRILAANGNFYDMNYDKVKVQRIGGIVPWDQVSMVGTET